MIRASDLPADLACALRDAGWTERDRDITASIAALEADGYPVPVPEAVRQFLESVGNLSVYRPVKRGVDWFDFDVERANANIYPARVRNFSRHVGQTLYPIGEADCGNSTLLMDPLGRVFADAAGNFVAVGNSGAEAIETLYRGRHRRTIPRLVEAKTTGRAKGAPTATSERIKPGDVVVLSSRTIRLGDVVVVSSRTIRPEDFVRLWTPTGRDEHELLSAPQVVIFAGTLEVRTTTDDAETIAPFATHAVPTLEAELNFAGAS